MRRIALATVALIGLLAPAAAIDDGTGCDKFAWPLTRERALFAASNKADVVAGDTLAAAPDKAFVMRLQPGSQAAFILPPERKPRLDTWFGGAVRFPAPVRPDIYQVTLSGEAWIDVVQDGRFARSVGSTGRSDCPGVRKSVRLQLDAMPFVLQLSGIASDAVTVAIGPVAESSR